jgi:hypothetical protein
MCFYRESIYAKGAVRQGILRGKNFLIIFEGKLSLQPQKSSYFCGPETGLNKG